MEEVLLFWESLSCTGIELLFQLDLVLLTLHYNTGREHRMYLLLRPAEWGGKVLALSLMSDSIRTS